MTRLAFVSWVGRGQLAQCDVALVMRSGISLLIGITVPPLAAAVL